MSGAAQFDYFQHCVHCGLCLPNCPTYAELGDENDSPRGRIYLMQAVDTGRVSPSERIQNHLDLCLDCRACETVCPSGVQYGRLIESYRTNIDGDRNRGSSMLDRLVRRLVLHVFPSRRRIKWLRRALRLAGALGFFEFLRASGFARRYGAALRFAEVLDREPQALDPLPRYSNPQNGQQRARVGLFAGCVGEAILGATNRATHRVLRRNGCAVECPTDQACCGAIHFHAGDRAAAARLARANIDAFESPNGQADAVVVNVAGCGLMLKDYAELLSDDPQYAERARRFAGRVRDVSEFLTEHGVEPPTHALAERVTYHHACHLCHGQSVRQ
jgi:glycolate oxidase iron-sulfur subunit